jgi:hypothetical protein
MKLIIDIPEEVYAECRGDIYFPDTGGELFNAVQNGIPLDDVAVSNNCKNLSESYGEICVRCNKCGRFDKAESEGE